MLQGPAGQRLRTAAAWPLALATCLLLGSCRHAWGMSQQCQAIFDEYLQRHHKEASPYTGDNLLYFLHVPRTAGRTFHSCMLKLGTQPSRRCPKAYDHLRINVTVPNCFLLSSHDDFSVVSMLPDNVAVITQLRDPVDRVLSAYEFAVEVAARALSRPKNQRKKPGRISTEDVWPWSYLVPFFAEDMKAKVPAAKGEVLPEGGRWIEVSDGTDTWYHNARLNVSKWALTDQERAGLLPALDPYDNELVMSLKEFVDHPVATELLHNGAAFQVLGITNYSHWGDAASLRSCVLDAASGPATRDSLLSIAKERVKRFTHVGTTDRLMDSAASAMLALGLSVNSPAFGGGEDDTSPGDRGGGGGGHGSAAGRGRARHSMRSGSEGGGAADIPNLAADVRRTRLKLQGSQRALMDAMKEGLPERDLDALRQAVDHARKEMMDAQDALVAARDELNTGQHQHAQHAEDEHGGDEHNEDDVPTRRRHLMTAEQEQQGQELQRGQGHAEALAAVHNAAGPALDAAALRGGRQGRSLMAAEGGVAGGDSGSAGHADAGAVGAAGVDALGVAAAESNTRRRLQAAQGITDPYYKRIPNTDLGSEFQRCAARAQARSSGRRTQSLSVLTTADGRGVAFTKAARKQIPKEVIEHIRQLNGMDVELHALGLSLLSSHIQAQKEAGKWKDLPQVSLPKPKQVAPRIPKPRDDSYGDEL